MVDYFITTAVPQVRTGIPDAADSAILYKYIAPVPVRTSPVVQDHLTFIASLYSYAVPVQLLEQGTHTVVQVYLHFKSSFRLANQNILNLVPTSTVQADVLPVPVFQGIEAQVHTCMIPLRHTCTCAGTMIIARVSYRIQT